MCKVSRGIGRRVVVRVRGVVSVSAAHETMCSNELTWRVSTRIDSVWCLCVWAGASVF